MQAQGLVMPPGREPRHHLDALANPDLLGRHLAGSEPPHMKRPFKEELEEIRAGIEDTAGMSPENIVPAMPDAANTPVRFPISAGLYHDPMMY